MKTMLKPMPTKGGMTAPWYTQVGHMVKTYSIAG